MMKELLGQLLTFDSFPNFAYMMHSSTKIMDRHGASTSSCGDVNPDQETLLISMGFEKDLIQIVLENSSSDTSIDEIITMLSEMGGSCSGNGGGPLHSQGKNPKDIVISPRHHHHRYDKWKVH
jgi:hypothetical protein